MATPTRTGEPPTHAATSFVAGRADAFCFQVAVPLFQNKLSVEPIGFAHLLLHLCDSQGIHVSSIGI